MTKKIVVMIIALYITSPVAAMLVKIPKSSMFKVSQLGKRNWWISMHNGRTEDDKNITSYRQRHLAHAVGEDDVEIANFLLEKGERISDEYIMHACSTEMVNLFEKYGANIQELYTKDGNFLHYAIRNHLCQKKCIQYLLDKQVDPKVLTENGDNLWHSLINYWYNDETLLDRGKLLHQLGINPNQKNNKKKSAIYVLQEKIKEHNVNFPSPSMSDFWEDYHKISDRYALLLEIMKNKNFTQEKMNRE
ncbi:MAG TPA: ankyrin repeat domain-containing protein [Candidatus Babeliales bacterium]|jgi:hypothetical protein|nr:ankyrin repeat domain-containing protein [Candidatus Babeliales bacterium]